MKNSGSIARSSTEAAIDADQVHRMALGLGSPPVTEGLTISRQQAIEIHARAMQAGHGVQWATKRALAEAFRCRANASSSVLDLTEQRLAAYSRRR